jgi:nucleoside-diphosphate-sugar epimerase
VDWASLLALAEQHGVTGHLASRVLDLEETLVPPEVRQTLLDAPISFDGTGKQSRCFCDVRDTVVVNVGNTEEITIEDLARTVKDRTGSSSPIEYIPYDQAYKPGFEDMMRRVPSVEKAACPDRLSSSHSVERK